MNKAVIVAGLGWGDEGKGAAVDYLTRNMVSVNNTPLIIRYNGGCQCAHNVVTPDGRHHTFSQFGSGTFINGVKTHLSRFVLVNPISMMRENEFLKRVGVNDAMERMSVDPDALVVTPFDRALNRIKENRRGTDAHGSCGMGIGEARLYHNTYGHEALFVEDLKEGETARLKLRLKQVRAIQTAKSLSSELDDSMGSTKYINNLTMQYLSWASGVVIVPTSICFEWDKLPHSLIFEGAQGILLDERDEFAPHNTWTDTTFKNAYTILEEDFAFKGEVRRIGCVRAYATRHGAGPFPTEDKKLSEILDEPHNNADGFQGAFRRGHFDMASVRHALDITGGVDEIHMSHLDQLPKIYPNIDVRGYVSNIERLLETPITVLGYGPKAFDRKERETYVNARRRSTKMQSGISCCNDGEEVGG